jgi:hypothetical protein
MAGNFDPTDFVDPDFTGGARPAAVTTTPPASPFAAPAKPAAASAVPSGGGRVPSAGDLNAQVVAAQQALAELRSQQESLERERAQLEESRRRRLEFEQGRGEMATHLTRGVALLEEAEFAARRDAEQMARTLADLRAALAKVQALDEAAWPPAQYETELTRALTTLENARLEWNAARLKWPVLGGAAAAGAPAADAGGGGSALLRPQTFGDLCRLGFALTWPVAAACLAVGVLVVVALLRR